MTATPAAGPTLRARSRGPVRSGSGSSAPTPSLGHRQGRDRKPRMKDTALARGATTPNPRVAVSPRHPQGAPPRNVPNAASRNAGAAVPPNPPWAVNRNPAVETPRDLRRGATRNSGVVVPLNRPWAAKRNPGVAMRAASRDRPGANPRNQLRAAGWDLGKATSITPAGAVGWSGLGATPRNPLRATSWDAQGPPSLLGASGQAPLTLTRRGRCVLVCLLILAAVLVGFAVANGAAATRTGVPVGVYEKNLSQVVVRPGDSLWSIAARAEPDADPRLVIQQITEINALPGPEIVVGQRLWVPKR